MILSKQAKMLLVSVSCEYLLSDGHSHTQLSLMSEGNPRHYICGGLPSQVIWRRARAPVHEACSKKADNIDETGGWKEADRMNPAASSGGQ